MKARTPADADPARSRSPRRDRPSRSIDELDAAIVRTARHLSAVDYRLLVLVREFDDRLGWAKWAFESCAAWLAWRCGITESAAREKIRTAHALRDLPRITAAFAAGRLSYSKVRALTRAANALNEQALLEFALEATTPQIEERCRQLRNAAERSLHKAERAWLRRSLSLWRHPERGTATIRVEVPLEAGEVIARALDRAVAAAEAAAGPEFSESSWQSQQADALVALARAYLAEPGAPGPAAEPDGERGELRAEDEAVRNANPRAEPERHGENALPGGRSVPRPGQPLSTAAHYQVVIHVDEKSLRGGTDGRADLPIDVVRRLTCDGSLVAVVDNEAGIPVAISRRQRTVPTPLKRAVWARDRGCTFPGCRRSVRFIDAHHIRHWSQGGETSLENLTLVCSYHHALLHEGRCEVRRNEDGTLTFRRPDGRVIPRCGYRMADAEPDPIHLEGLDDPSAEGWLAALLSKPPPFSERPRARD